jgi:hypothetical protein
LLIMSFPESFERIYDIFYRFVDKEMLAERGLGNHMPAFAALSRIYAKIPIKACIYADETSLFWFIERE